MKLDYSERFKSAQEQLKMLEKTYQNGFILEDDEVMNRWLKSAENLILEITNIRTLVGIQYWDNKLKKQMQNELNK